MSERQAIVKPLGLWTSPGLYGAMPPGAMRECTDLVMRAPALLSTSPQAVFVTTVGANDDVIHAMAGILAGRMVTFTRSTLGVWTVRTDTTATTAISMQPSTRVYSQTGRLGIMRARNRVFANSENGRPVVLDTDNPTALPQTIRHAGLGQAWIRSSVLSATNASALKASQCAGYAVCYRRRFSDGYELVSRPSPILTINTVAFGACNVTFQALSDGTAQGGGLQAGDILELYRTDVIDTTVFTTDPGTTLKLVKTRTLTAADLVAVAINITDTQPAGPLGVTFGKELYTNPAIGGLLSVNRVPEICRSLAYFKDYAFYGNISQRPQWEFTIPGGIASTVNGGLSTGFNTTGFRANGIGIRRISGTTVIGVNTITGVALADFNGLAIGQQIMSNHFAAGTAITALNSGGGIVTMSNVAVVAVAPGNIDLSDVVEITYNGVTRVYSWGVNGNADLRVQDWVTGMAQFWLAPELELTTSENLPFAQDATVGIKTITWVIEPWVPNTGANFLVRASNGANYSPAVPDMSTAAKSFAYTDYKNLLRWSKNAQPEHCPPAAPINETFVGGNEIIALVPTRDALWVFCTDGLYRVSGAGGQWRVDPVDTTLILASPRGACALNDTVYAYTNRGFVRVSDSGIEALSDNTISDLLPGSEYVETASILIEANQADEEIAVCIDQAKLFLFATRYGLWSTINFQKISAFAYWRYPPAGAPCLAYGDFLAGAQPGYWRWNHTSSFRTPSAVFQPSYAKDPFSARQSQNLVAVFASANSGVAITPVWNGNVGSPQTLKGGAVYAFESRAVFGVPRIYAMSHSISVGWRGAGGLATAHQFYGLAITTDNETDQNLKR